MSPNKLQNRRAILIMAACIALVAAVTWLAPSLSAASLNTLFRLRGLLKPPEDLVIVAIDDRSLQRFGRWPWPRSLMAEAIEKLTETRCSAVGLDVIYAEPSAAAADQRLAAAIHRNGRVILPAYLYESEAGANSENAPVLWLRPLPSFAAGAARVGHAHISPDVDGTARRVQLSKSDDRGDRLWVFGLEVLRTAERLDPDNFEEQQGGLRVGQYRIPILDETLASTTPGLTIIRSNEISLNYAGPARTFSYVSIVDLIDGKIPPGRFEGKIVLIGSAAQSMGDTRVAPFMHLDAGGQSAGGQEMPGVEIHANIIHTIRRSLTLKTPPDWVTFALSLAIVLCAASTIRWLDGWKQLAALFLLLTSITMGSYLAFSRFHFVPPLAPMLVAYLATIPLMINRMLFVSRTLDDKLARLTIERNRLLSKVISPEEHTGSLERKLRSVDELTGELLSRMSLTDGVLSSMSEGVLVAGPFDQIIFANQETLKFFNCEGWDIAGLDFVEFLAGHGVLAPADLRRSLTAARNGTQKQLQFAAPDARQYSLVLTALSSQEDDLEPESPVGVVGLISDITERTELDRKKTEALQWVSHELRTPLASIQGLSSALLKFPVPVAESSEALSTIHHEAVRLSDMITRYLDLARLESGALPLRPRTISTRILIDHSLRALSILATERRITIRTRISHNAQSLNGDPQLLTLAVNNLLSNAIKYSPADSEIKLLVEARRPGVSITVADQGPGVPEDRREKIFEKFYRLDRERSSGIVGAGLGLSLVKEIVERHNGVLQVECPPQGGSSFTIQLP
jgi:CHASE2 domain-containing sensor protein/signal transduction histidine kinase